MARHETLCPNYVFPNDVTDRLMMSRIFELVPKYCFQGHTARSRHFHRRWTFLPAARNWATAIGWLTKKSWSTWEASVSLVMVTLVPAT